MLFQQFAYNLQLGSTVSRRSSQLLAVVRWCQRSRCTSRQRRRFETTYYRTWKYLIDHGLCWWCVLSCRTSYRVIPDHRNSRGRCQNRGKQTRSQQHRHSCHMWQDTGLRRVSCIGGLGIFMRVNVLVKYIPPDPSCSPHQDTRGRDGINGPKPSNSQGRGSYFRSNLG